jgi:nucleotide-binding universal stress UspA family protein
MMDVWTQQPSPGNSDVVINEGNVVDAIIETAAQYDGDTIVMEPTR